MTENKRFTFKQINEEHISANIYDNGTFIASIGIGEELIVELLNSLNDENEQLKEQNKNLKDLLKSMADRNNEIWLDNGQIIRLNKVFKGEWR